MAAMTSPASGSTGDSDDSDGTFVEKPARRPPDSHGERLFEMTRHAKTESRRELPFEKYWGKRHAPGDKEYLVESNAYERALLKYVAAMRGTSVKALVREYAREAAIREAMGEKPFR